MKVLYVSLVDWYWIKQRPQQICEKLSKKNISVDFFCRIPWRPTNKGYSHSNEEKTKKRTFRFNPKLRVIREFVLPFSANIIIRKLNTFLLKKRISRLVKINQYDVIILTHPTQVSLLSQRNIDRVKIIYDCMDDQLRDLTGKSLVRSKELEKSLVQTANSIVCSSRQLVYVLQERYSITHKFEVINNGVDFKRFSIKPSRATNDPVFENTKSVKITYVGTIGSWFDFDLVNRLASSFQEAAFFIVGPINTTIPSGMKSNIHFLGSRPYSDVPGYLWESDVLIMPFIVNSTVESVNPVKLYEYLSTGKPVLCVKYGETRQFEKVLYLYNSFSEANAKLKKIIDTLPEEVKKAAERRQFAEKNDWEKRASDFIKVFNE
ncbi:putative teichuronic acid biosynthesis glycosyltransferase TuaH [Lacticaseibacillus paracasei]|uniref:glycosyltransferase n=1 Tax=Lacticaseibacillus paracasei TaxID=1597 RepID=UPI0009148952|nr:glycosyltransferase [Lacticaseibacillus paracasei]GAV17436.1 putative teichuronic acid biosynthesis glycosyltransferase TuaH [Lacticaseibacillus paracasei]